MTCAVRRTPRWPGGNADPQGDMLDIPYGQAATSSNWQPMLFVQGRGVQRRHRMSWSLNPLLKFTRLWPALAPA